MVITPEFANEKVTSVLFVLDGSMSMNDWIDPSDPNSESKVAGLNAGLKLGYDMMRSDRVLSRSAMVGIVTICEPITWQPFTALDQWPPPLVVCRGGTPFGQAINRACDELAAFLHGLNVAGRPFNKPTLMIVSDGEPAGESASETAEGISRVKSLEAAGKVFLISAGITDEDCRRLDAMGFQRPAECVSRIQWRELFRIVTASAGSIARGQQPMP